jgi:hypothetical protein
LPIGAFQGICPLFFSIFFIKIKFYSKKKKKQTRITALGGQTPSFV